MEDTEGEARKVLSNLTAWHHRRHHIRVHMRTQNHAGYKMYLLAPLKFNHFRQQIITTLSLCCHDSSSPSLATSAHHSPPPQPWRSLRHVVIEIVQRYREARWARVEAYKDAEKTGRIDVDDALAFRSSFNFSRFPNVVLFVQPQLLKAPTAWNYLKKG